MSLTPQGPPAPFVDRRQSPRLEALGRITATWLSGELPIEIYDVCQGGFSMVSDVALQTNSLHRFKVRAARAKHALEVSARVRYCRPFSRPKGAVQYLTGLAFVALDDKGRAAVDGLLDTLTSTLSFD